jgi:conjugative relaxase-like TrwC/TraI family protein
LGKLAPGQHAYYVDAVALGAEEYYTGGKEAPGQWVGAGAEHLGLAGQVDADALANLLRHADPSGVWRLTSSQSVPTVAAFDATFCAPKSVSLLYALGSPEVSNEVRNATDAAVAASFEVLQRVACRVRRGAGGKTVLDGGGFVGASFRHRTSRAGDPHLHTHVLVTNVAHCEVDDRWTALDARLLYGWASPVGHLYEAHLRWELTHRLGVQWQPVKNGIADIAGIDRGVLREFSTRRKEIEAHLEEYGQSSAKAAQVATYATRRPKDHTLDAGTMRERWWERARDHGLDPERLDGVTGRSRDPLPVDRRALFEWLSSEQGLTARASSFGERDVLKAICNALPGGAPVPAILDLTEQFLTSNHVLMVRGHDTVTIRRKDGTIVPAPVGESKWTTPDLIEVEIALVCAAENAQASGAGQATPEALEEAIAARPTLTGEQDAMVRAVCSSGDGVEVVEGAAGAGKTFALAAARDAWRNSGFQVIGCSLAARAAKQLETDAGIPAATLHRVLADLDAGRLRLDDHCVVVVDEAAMVGTRQLHGLVDHTTKAGAKVVLVGDPFQLPEIDAGGAFRGLQARLGASQLVDNRRQTEAWEREALAELRTGDADQAVDAYLAHDRVHSTDAHQQLVTDWLRAWTAGEDVLMVALRMADVDRLNTAARATLQRWGDLPADQVHLGGRGYAVGDQVLALRNDHAMGLLNGTRGEITAIDTTRHELTIHITSRHDVSVPFAYAEAGHLTHGYATTIHKAQGATVDRCLALLDDTTTREAIYTALSRGRHGNDAYVVQVERRADERHGPESDRDPFESLRANVSRSGGDVLAIDQLRARRAELAGVLSSGPPDVRENVASLDRQLGRSREWLDAAEQRRQRVEADLARLGRFGHRHLRADLRSALAGARSDIERHQADITTWEGRLADLEPARATRAAWEEEHRADLDEHRAIDRYLVLHDQHARDVDRVARRELDRGVGIEL